MAGQEVSEAAGRTREILMGRAVEEVAGGGVIEYGRQQAVDVGCEGDQCQGASRQGGEAKVVRVVVRR